MTASFALILHAHLPFVRHPEHEDFLEEDWLFEAITETYLPVLRLMRRLAEDDVPFRLTISLTPTLATMLRDPLLQRRYLRHLDRLLGLTRQEIEKHRHQPQLLTLAKFYREFFSEARDLFELLSRDLVRAFRELQDHGSLEIIASAATHAFLPALQNFPEAQRAQIQIGCDSYRELFGREPRGFWLPECGYSHELDGLLQEANLRWFVVDTHGLTRARPRPRAAIFSPCFTPAGPAVFAREPASSRAVWDAASGYPGDSDYRDFYRDIGFDRSEEELREFVRPSDLRKSSGIKYHRVSNGTGEKFFYDPGVARVRANEHAHDFLARQRSLFHELARSRVESIVVSPFDAELFGHWWFEGPIFLESFFRRAAREEHGFQLTTPGDFLSAHPSQQIVRPSPSSWGENGFSQVWLDPKNAWIYPHLHAATAAMIHVARQHRHTSDAAIERALRQAARELLLAQASDWPFLIKNQTASEYATARIENHLENFSRALQQLQNACIDLDFLARCESFTPIFPNLNWRHYL